jgi:hypothetical protein
MKKVIGLLVLMMVFAFGFGAGQYFYEKGLTIPGLAMASAKPKVTNVRVTEFHPSAPHQWGIFIHTDRAIDVVEKKNATKAALYFK